MDWYYARSGQQTGPIEEAEFIKLVIDGTVSPGTLVWSHSLNEWVPCSKVFDPDGEPIVISGNGTCTCQECGRQFPNEQPGPPPANFVCASCKPRFMRKVQEQEKQKTMLNSAIGYSYASVWLRLCAKVIDIFVLSAGIFGFMMIVAFIIPSETNKAILDFMNNYIKWISIGLLICYDSFFLGGYGATPGKMAVGIKVVRSGGYDLSYERATARRLVEFFSGFFFCIGYLIAFLDDERQTLHDRICDTRVVNKYKK